MTRSKMGMKIYRIKDKRIPQADAQTVTHNERNRVDVVDDVVGDAVQFHGSGLRGQVTSHLVVSDPVDGVEQEAGRRILISRISSFRNQSTHTLQAETARLTSSTHASSYRIHSGRSPTTCEGLALSPEADCQHKRFETAIEVRTVSGSEKLLGVKRQRALADFTDDLDSDGAEKSFRSRRCIRLWTTY